MDNNNTMPASVAALPFDYQIVWAAGATEQEILQMWSLNELDAQSSQVDVSLN